ncbi:hypothetical protein AX16_006362 [Volvariella volvacea WC 439]|nr:hypothetical protein AX16_006362 [Volvariella volvacea WC 439]
MTTSPSTIILIGGTSEQKKSFLLFLTAICTGKTADQSFLSGFEPLIPVDSSNGSSLYRIQCLNGTRVDVLDTPELTGNHQVQVTFLQKAMEELLTTFKAIVVLGDANVDGLGLYNVKPILELMRSIFPRSIAKNVYFLFMNIKETPDGSKIRLGELPDWLRSANCDMIDDMLNLLNIVTRLKQIRDQEALHATFSTKFNDAARHVEKLLASVKLYSVQALDPRVLYRKAMEVESEIFEALALEDLGAATSRDEKDILKVDKLVDEYRLLATSPDFLNHLDYFLPLLSRLGKGNALLERSISKLEDTRDRLQVLQGDAGLKYPKGFIIS